MLLERVGKHGLASDCAIINGLDVSFPALLILGRP